MGGAILGDVVYFYTPSGGAVCGVCQWTILINKGNSRPEVDCHSLEDTISRFQVGACFYDEGSTTPLGWNPLHVWEVSFMDYVPRMQEEAGVTPRGYVLQSGPMRAVPHKNLCTSDITNDLMCVRSLKMKVGGR